MKKLSFVLAATLFMGCGQDTPVAPTAAEVPAAVQPRRDTSPVQIGDRSSSPTLQSQASSASASSASASAGGTIAFYLEENPVTICMEVNHAEACYTGGGYGILHEGRMPSKGLTITATVDSTSIAKIGSGRSSAGKTYTQHVPANSCDDNMNVSCGNPERSFKGAAVYGYTVRCGHDDRPPHNHMGR